jgi:hypothetical protein
MYLVGIGKSFMLSRSSVGLIALAVLRIGALLVPGRTTQTQNANRGNARSPARSITKAGENGPKVFD